MCITMLVCLFFSCCFAQPLEKIFDQDDKILPGAELMDLVDGENSEDGNNPRELSTKLDLDNNLQQTISDILVDMKDMKKKIESLGTRGSWCGFLENHWRTNDGTITYDHLSYSDTNMKISGPALDIKSGNYTVKTVITILLPGYQYS